MKDKYANFSELASAEPKESYSTSFRGAGAGVVIIAPHGGGIEPGTSEIALGIAGEDIDYYLFEGLKVDGNRALHITSSSFDEPQCIDILRKSNLAITVHGEDGGDEVVYLGGLDKQTLALVREELLSRRFLVKQHSDPSLQGLHERNICNLGISRKGVQLEISNGLRRSFFESFNLAGRQKKTPRFSEFCDGVRAAVKRGMSDVERGSDLIGRSE